MEGPGRSKVGSRSPRTHKRMRTTVGHRGGRKSTVGVFRLCASAGKKRDKKKNSRRGGVGAKTPLCPACYKRSSARLASRTAEPRVEWGGDLKRERPTDGAKRGTNTRLEVYKERKRERENGKKERRWRRRRRRRTGDGGPHEGSKSSTYEPRYSTGNPFSTAIPTVLSSPPRFSKKHLPDSKLSDRRNFIISENNSLELTAIKFPMKFRNYIIYIYINR